MKKTVFWRKIMYIAIILLLLGLIFMLLKDRGNNQNAENSPAKTTEKKVKEVQTLSFGAWQPQNFREILGTVQSSQEVAILSNLSGNLDQVLVDLGDEVQKNQVLAKFSRENDLSQISYENALNSLSNAQNSAENSIISAEIALNNAQNDLAQMRETTAQNHRQVFNLLYEKAQSAQTTITTEINFLDNTLGVSNKAKADLSGAANQIGRNNFILKNQTKNQINDLIRTTKNTEYLANYEIQNSAKILSFARQQYQTLLKIQKVLRQTSDLINGTSTSSSFPENFKAQLQQRVDQLAAQHDGAIMGLKSQIESAKSSGEQINSSILSAENRVKNAQANLKLTKSSSQNQIANIQNQVNLAQKSVKDFQVKAPFAGKISAKFVDNFARVAPGQKLFLLTANNQSPEIIAYLSVEELKLLNGNLQVKIRLNNGEMINSQGVVISGQLNATTQKMEVKIKISPEDFAGNSRNLMVGSLVNILLPISTENSNLVPISAISFEPDGAEVFVVNPLAPLSGGSTNSAKKVERRKVQTGKIVSNAVEILGGLEPSKKVILYRNRVSAGELVEVKN